MSFIISKNLYLNKKIIFLLLSSIAIISFILKFYHMDFSIPPTSDDTYGYVLRSFSILNNDFTEPIRKTLGWPILISVFYNLFNSENLLDYVNTARFLSMVISTLTIFPMYLFARKFFDAKFSIMASSMLVFEPHLLYNSTSALSESIFIFITIFSCYFILEKKFNYSYLLAFFIGGLAVWMRFNGLITIVILSLIFFILYKPSKKNITKFSLCLLIFLIVISPMLIQKNEQYGNPFYFSQTNQLFSGNYANILSENSRNLDYSYSDFIDNYGLNEFIQRFLLNGISNLLETISKLAFPYLIIFLPFGIILSFRFSVSRTLIGSLWIMLLGSISIFVIYFSIMPDKRLLYHTFPFLIILSTIFVQKIIQNGLSTFSFSQQQKNLIILFIIVLILIASCIFTIRYDSPSELIYKEKLSFTEQITDKFNGNILDGGHTLEFLKFVNFNESPEDFKSYKTKNQTELFKNPDKLNEIILSSTSLQHLIEIGKQYDLDYIAVNKNNIDPLYPFLDDIYHNENKYHFLEKVFDTEINNNQKFHAKIFKINYEKFFNSP
jgi:hypothetical protein